MANQTELILNLKTIMDISDVKHNADQIQQFFGKLKLSDSMTKDVKKIFENLEKSVDSYQAKLQQKPSKGSTGGLEKDAQNIIKLFNQLESKIGKISTVDLKKSFKFDDANLSKLNTELEETQTKLREIVKNNFTQAFRSSEATQELLKIRNGVGNVDEAIVNATKKSGGFRNLFKNIDAGNLTEAQHDLETFEKYLTKNVPEGAKGLDTVKNYINQMREAMQQAAQSGDIQTLSTKINEIKTQINAGETGFFKDLAIDVKNAGTATENCSKWFSIFSNNIIQTRQSQAQLNSELDQMKSRITYFFGINNAVQLLRRGITSTVNTIKELDEVMTKTAVVTDFTVGDMWEQLPQYTKRANEFGLAIKDVYEADTLFYQQGLKTNEVMALSNETMKMARIAGLDTAEATDRMTNALRGFNMELNETNAQNVADVYSKLAAISASDVDELSVAMTKTASIASNAGASFENTAAFIAQIVETTRESAETAGTALKTVIARFTELQKDPSEIGEVDGEIVDANKIETALRSVGVALRDTDGQFRDFDDVILELSGKWDSLDTNTQRYIATIAAGSRQQSRFIALMSNNARLTELTTAANSAAGASQKQYEKTLESLETKFNRLKNAANEFLTTIGNSDVIKGVVDLLTGLLNILNKATSWGPRLIQMFTKTAAAIGIFAGLKKVVQNGLNGIGTMMGLKGAEAGTAYTTAMQKAMSKNIGAKSAFYGMMKGQGFKATMGTILNGTKTADYEFKVGASDAHRRLRADEIDAQQFDSELKTLGTQFGYTGKQVDMFSENLAKATFQQQAHEKELGINRAAIEKNTKSELDEILANKSSTETEKKEAIVNKFGVDAENAEILANEAAAGTEGLETTENYKAVLAEASERKVNEQAAIAELKEILANKSSTTEEMKEAMINKLGVDAEKAEWLANWKAAGAEDLETTENFKAAVSEAVETKSNYASGGSKIVNDALNKIPGGGKTSGGILNGLKGIGTKAGNFLKGPSGYVAAAAAALAITAGIATGVTAAIDSSVETAEEKLENLTKRTELQADATEQAVSRLSESTSLVSNLETMKEEISGLTAGTAEWTEKVFELNSQMSKVISQYGQLADEKYMATSANGIMSLTEEGQEEYLRLVQQDALAAQGRNLSLQRRQIAMQKEMAINSAIDTDAVSKAEEDAAATSTWIGGGVGAVGGIGAGVAVAKGGAVLGSFAGPLGALIGGVAGGIIGVTAGAIIGESIKSEYNIREKTFEDVINKASENGFTAEGKTSEEIEQFLSGIDATDSELASLREYLKDSGSEFDKLTANVRELDLQEEANLRQEASVEAQRLGLERGEKERFEDIYIDDAKENSEEFDKLVQKELEAMADKYEVGFDAIFQDWNDTGEFEFDTDYIGIYEDFAKEMGWKFDANNEDNQFIDLEGKVVDMSEWTDAQINSIVAEAKVRNELNEKLQEEQKIVEDKIRKDPNSIYNLLGARLGVGKQEWLYDLTKEQIEAFNSQLNQVTIQGGNADAYANFIMNIANAAVNAGMDMANVMDILASQSVETKADFWNLKDSLEAAADAQEILGFEISDTLIEAAIDAADAIGNIDLKKLSEGAETIKELVDKIATSTDKVVTEEELQELRGLGLRDSQYQVRDDGSAVITDPNWQFGLMRNLEKQSIEDIRNKYETNKDLQVKEKIVKDNSTYTIKSDYLATSEKYLPNSQYQDDYSQIFSSERGKQLLFEKLGGEGDYSQDQNSYAYLTMTHYLEAIENEAYNASSFNEPFDRNNLSRYAGNIDYWVIDDVISSFNNELNSSISKEVKGTELKDFSLEEIYNDLENFNDDQELDSLVKVVNDVWGHLIDEEATVYNAKELFKKLYESGTKEALEEAIQAAKNDTEFQSLLEGSWLGQEALNYSLEKDNDVEKIYSEKALDSIDTMAYSIEGAEVQIATYATQVDASSETLKAFTIENYKAAKSVDSLLSDLQEYSDALDTPGTQKYNKAISEISQSIQNMGWADSMAEANNFFQTHKDGFELIMKGGEDAQRAYEEMAKEAAKDKAITLSLSDDLTTAFNQVLNLNWEVGQAYNLMENAQFSNLFNWNDREGLNILASLYEAAGFTVTIDFKSQDFLIARNAAYGTGEFAPDEEEQLWENTFDRLYNLTVDINDELRDRNKLEREYQRLLKDTENLTAQQVKTNIEAQGASLVNSIDLERTKIKGRKQQMEELAANNSEFKDFVYWDEESGEPKINWNLFNAKTGVWSQEKGDEATEFVNQWKEWADEIFDSENNIADYEDQLDELRDTGREEYMELQEKVYDAILEREEELIENMQTVNDSINEANNDLLNGLQKSINKLRQDRQNEETEKDIADQEQQLAYLSQSTTADPLEIMKLEESVNDARQSYTDTLIDQKISELQEQNEQAANQREKQISIAQAQLDYNKENGVYWKEVDRVMKEGIGLDGKIDTNSELYKVLKNASDWNSMSVQQKQDWKTELTNLSVMTTAYGNGFTFPQLAQEETLTAYVESNNARLKSLEDSEDNDDFPLLSNINESDKSLSLTSTTGAYGSLGNDISKDLKTDKQYEFKGWIDINENGKLDNEDDVGFRYTDSDGNEKQGFIKASNVIGSDQSVEEIEAIQSEQKEADHDKKNFPFNYATEHNSLIGQKVQVTGNNRIWKMDNWDVTTNKVNPQWWGKNDKFGFEPNETITIQQALMDSNGNIWIRPSGVPDGQWMSFEGVTSNYQKILEGDLASFEKQNNYWTQFKTGGLADFTGPAWLDGTKSAPEIVLNAQDTRNFLQLRDILSDLFKNGNFERSSFSGDNYYDIDINVDEISNDYDVDQLATRIKQQIISDSMYRNVNAINFMR